MRSLRASSILSNIYTPLNVLPTKPRVSMYGIGGIEILKTGMRAVDDNWCLVMHTKLREGHLGLARGLLCDNVYIVLQP